MNAHESRLAYIALACDVGAYVHAGSPAWVQAFRTLEEAVSSVCAWTRSSIRPMSYVVRA